MCQRLRRKEDMSNFVGMQSAVSEDIAYMNTNETNTYEQLNLSYNTTIVRTDNIYASICSDDIPEFQVSSMTAEYYNLRSQDIKIADIWKIITEKKANNCKLFQTEYELLNKHLNAKLTEGKKQNDIDGILDENLKDATGNRRLNSKFIHGYEKELKFVAAMGPSRATANDFWELVWQKKTEIIVMLSKRKHVQYWPIGRDGHAECFGNVDVKLVKTRTFNDYAIRTFEVTKSSEYRDDGSQAFSVTQYHFTSWPINDDPDTTWSFVNFWHVVDSLNTKSPIVVHCCERIMPAGMFIALDILYNQATREGRVSLFQTVTKLGVQWSTNMLQTWEQYMFLHEALAEILLLGTHCVWTKQMKEITAFMNQIIDDSKATNFDLQFRRIQESTNGPVSVEESKRRTAPAFPVPLYFQSLHALYVPTYPDRYGIIITRTPNEYNLHNFWTLVEEQKSKTIIMMTDNSHPYDKVSCFLGAEEENDFGRFAVTFSEERTFGNFIQRIFKLEENIENKTSRRIITQYTFTGWNDDNIVPHDTQSLVDMISHVLNWQILIQQNEPVVVCCRDGSTQSGLVSVILNEINRIRSTGDKVNIVESVKTLKDVNKNIITSPVQLKFCYKAILCYLGMD